MINKQQFNEALAIISKQPELIRNYENQLKEYASKNDDAMFNLQHATFAFINEAYKQAEKRGLLHDKWEEQ